MYEVSEWSVYDGGLGIECYSMKESPQMLQGSVITAAPGIVNSVREVPSPGVVWRCRFTQVPEAKETKTGLLV